MTKQHCSRFCLTALLGLIVTTSLQPTAQGQMKLEGGTLSERLMASVTFIPPGRGKPKQTSGGASRDTGFCPQDQAQSAPYLLPVAPQQTQALTIAAHPTLMAYIPATTAKQVYLSVTKANDGQHIYHSYIPIDKAGVIAVKLPQDAPPLEVNQRYRWSLSLICGSALAPDSPMVESEVERIQLGSELTAQLTRISSSEKRADLLGKQGIWYDTLAILAESRAQNPHDADLVTSWQAILGSEGLEAVAAAPILER